jgi:hypothetical protein
MIDHDCTNGKRTIIVEPEIYAPSNDVIGKALLGTAPRIAMDGCPIDSLYHACEHGHVSWPLYLGYCDDSGHEERHNRIPKATERT